MASSALTTNTEKRRPSSLASAKKTLAALENGLADAVIAAAKGGREPVLDIPTRTLSNVKYNKQKKFLEMGRGKNRRQLFNLSQAKSYMQTLLVASGCKRLIEQQKTTSLRGLYYMLKHSIEGLKEEPSMNRRNRTRSSKTSKSRSIPCAKNSICTPRRKRDMVGPITLVDRGDEIDCTRMGSGGYGIPSIGEPEIDQVQEMRREIHPARRKRTRSGNGSTKTSSGGSTMHPDPRRRPAAARRPPHAQPAAQRAEAAGLLPAG